MNFLLFLHFFICISVCTEKYCHINVELLLKFFYLYNQIVYSIKKILKIRL